MKTISENNKPSVRLGGGSRKRQKVPLDCSMFCLLSYLYIFCTCSRTTKIHKTCLESSNRAGSGRSWASTPWTRLIVLVKKTTLLCSEAFGGPEKANPKEASEAWSIQYCSQLVLLCLPWSPRVPCPLSWARNDS